MQAGDRLLITDPIDQIQWCHLVEVRANVTFNHTGRVIHRGDKFLVAKGHPAVEALLGAGYLTQTECLGTEPPGVSDDSSAEDPDRPVSVPGAGMGMGVVGPVEGSHEHGGVADGAGESEPATGSPSRPKSRRASRQKDARSDTGGGETSSP